MHAFSFGYLHLPHIIRCFFFSSAAFVDVGDGSTIVFGDVMVWRFEREQ
jgi:hypothetical protein